MATTELVSIDGIKNMKKARVHCWLNTITMKKHYGVQIFCPPSHPPLKGTFQHFFNHDTGELVTFPTEEQAKQFIKELSKKFYKRLEEKKQWQAQK